MRRTSATIAVLLAARLAGRPGAASAGGRRLRRPRRASASVDRPALPLRRPRAAHDATGSTVVERIDLRDSTIDRWWYLRGSWYIPAVAYDRSPGGLSADGGTLVLVSLPPLATRRSGRGSRSSTRGSSCATRREAGQRPRHAIRRVDLAGALQLRRDLARRLAGLPRSTTSTAGARLDPLRGAGAATSQRPARCRGRSSIPRSRRSGCRAPRSTRVSSPDGRWAYTLYERLRGALRPRARHGPRPRRLRRPAPARGPARTLPATAAARRRRPQILVSAATPRRPDLAAARVDTATLRRGSAVAPVPSAAMFGSVF